MTFDLHLSSWILQLSANTVRWFGSLSTQELHFIHVLACIFTPSHKERCIIVRRQCFVMAEKQEHSGAREFHSCSSKFVCPVSLVSLLICTAALVRIEIINQRVHTVEDLVTDARQIQNLIKVSTEAPSFKHSERVESVGEFDHKITKEEKDATEGMLLNYSVRN